MDADSSTSYCCVLCNEEKNLDDNSNVEISRKKQWILCAVCSLAVGCYDGFYGPGTGTFLLILYTGVAKLPVAKASGTMKLANLSSNIMALVVFLFSGKIVIYLGLAASVFFHCRALCRIWNGNEKWK